MKKKMIGVIWFWLMFSSAYADRLWQHVATKEVEGLEMSMYVAKLTSFSPPAELEIQVKLYAKNVSQKRMTVLTKFEYAVVNKPDNIEWWMIFTTGKSSKTGTLIKRSLEGYGPVVLHPGETTEVEGFSVEFTKKVNLDEMVKKIYVSYDVNSNRSLNYGDLWQGEIDIKTWEQDFNEEE